MNFSRKELELIRVKSIKAWKEGMSVNEIAERLNLHRGSVSRWITQYKRYGATILRSKRSSGRPKKIDCRKYYKEIIKIIKKPATSYDYDNPLWNCKKIKETLKNELAVKIGLTTVWRYLKDIGLSSQKPERRALEQNQKEAKKWLQITWPKIKEKAKKERAIIFFQDESTVALNSNLGKTWSKIGMTPIIRVSGGKASVPVISAISVTGKLFFSIPKKNVTSKEFILFLKNLLNAVPRKRVYLITDNAPTHKSKMVKDFFDSHERLVVHYLPKYSPELNPDEYTWSHLKQNELKALPIKNKAELRSKVAGKMRRIQRKKGLVKSFFRRSNVT